MLENGLFFLLGFLLAALIAFLVAPAIWRRAVVLTRRRIESTIPISLTEIAAEKDQLRAGFAIRTRKLEVTMEKLQEKAAEQEIELSRRRERIADLGEEQANLTAHIAALDEQIAGLKEDLRQRGEQLDETAQQLSRTQERLLEKGEAHSELLKRHAELVDDFDGQKVEMAARETRVEMVRDEQRATANELKETRSALNDALSKARAAEAALERERKRTLELEAKTDSLRMERSDLEARVERRDADLGRLRDMAGIETENEELERLRQENDTLRREAEEMRGRLEKMFDNSGSDAAGPQSEDLAALRDTLRTIESERDALRLALGSAGETDPGVAADHALIREKISELAARFTALSAIREGDASPIMEALAKAPPRQASDDASQSLADRIRAIKEFSEEA